MPLNPREGKWAVVCEDPTGIECPMAYWDTQSEAAKDCKEYELQSPPQLELTWFIRYER